ncbi:hypothetical protein HED50_19680 [Ochrobactrum oryzae]|nr:hypothetical protein [Brucella oryzae]
MSGSVTIKATAEEREISGFDTAVTYRRLRQHLPDDALMMQLQLSLSPLPVRLVKDRQHGSHIATTLAALTGATGCLPPCYEETALAQTLNRNDSYAAFIALFQRNLADLLVEASAKYSAHRQSRRTQPAQNPFSNAILALAGCEHRDEKMNRSFSPCSMRRCLPMTGAMPKASKLCSQIYSAFRLRLLNSSRAGNRFRKMNAVFLMDVPGLARIAASAPRLEMQLPIFASFSARLTTRNSAGFCRTSLKHNSLPT